MFFDPALPLLTRSKLVLGLLEGAGTVREKDRTQGFSAPPHRESLGLLFVIFKRLPEDDRGWNLSQNGCLACEAELVGGTAWGEGKKALSVVSSLALDPPITLPQKKEGEKKTTSYKSSAAHKILIAEQVNRIKFISKQPDRPFHNVRASKS